MAQFESGQRDERSGAEDALLQDRLRQLAAFNIQIADAYPSEFPERTHSANDILSEAESLVGQTVVVAGRIAEIREHKNSVFYDVADETGLVQATMSTGSVSKERLEASRRVFGRGDIVAVRGEIGRTETDDSTVIVSDMLMLAKALSVPPLHLTNPDARFAQRYLDLMVNQASRERLRARSEITHYIRQVLHDRGMIEVESPVLNTFYNGGVAKPFVAHHNALDAEAYLRVTSELYLKQLVVGGLEGVFEIAKQFRNEGMSRIYNPEFTVLEMYQAYRNHEWMMDLVEETISGAALRVNGKTDVEWNGHTINLASPWQRVPMHDAVSHSLGYDRRLTDDELLEIGAREDISGDITHVLLVLFKRHIEPQLIQPTFITEFPVELSPMAKADPKRPGTVQKYMCYIGGALISDGNYEENDPIRQRENLAAQRRQLQEIGAPDYPRDPSFLDALEHGMPPLAGGAIGIDRLTMLLTGTSHIREVIAFRPRRLGGNR